jgi:hypothetical protein
MERDDVFRSIELLKKLLYGPTPTVFSGGSLQVLLNRFQNDLANVPEGNEHVMLRHWERSLEDFQKVLFEHADRVIVTPADHPRAAGITALLVTEKATGESLTFCPPPPH